MSQHRVLIVDDEEEYLSSLKEGFVPFRDTFLVHTATSGSQALEILDSFPVDMVATDLKMPGMDGFQLLAHLRMHHPALPIIVISAFASDKVKQRLAALGVTTVLDKPLDLDTLTSVILKGLTTPSPSGGLEGISMPGFLQLIEMEKKSCSLIAGNGSGEQGNFLFLQGKLVDARFQDLRGEDAAFHMLAWDSPTLSFEEMAEESARETITAPLMSILLEASRRADEALEHAAKDMVKQYLSNNAPAQGGQGESGNEPFNNEHEGRPTMAGLKPILKEMADEMDGVIALAVVGMDGILVAAHNPTGADVEVMSAKFAMLLKLASRTSEQIKGMGEFEENLVQAQNVWVLARYLSQNYYLSIAVSRDGTLGNIRLVAQKYVDKLARAL